MLNKQLRLFELFETYPEKTCFVIKDYEVIFTSEKRGVRPLLDYMVFHPEKADITVVDKIMGKGAVFLAIAAGCHKNYHADHQQFRIGTCEKK